MKLMLVELSLENKRKNLPLTYYGIVNFKLLRHV